MVGSNKGYEGFKNDVGELHWHVLFLFFYLQLVYLLFYLHISMSVPTLLCHISLQS